MLRKIILSGRSWEKSKTSLSEEHYQIHGCLTQNRMDPDWIQGGPKPQQMKSAFEMWRGKLDLPRAHILSIICGNWQGGLTHLSPGAKDK